jgi:hypothetical protein
MKTLYVLSSRYYEGEKIKEDDTGGATQHA